LHSLVTQGGTPLKRRVFVVLFLSIFSSMLGVGIIVPLLPMYAESLGASGIWVGVIFSGFSISRSIFMPIIGQWSDKRGRKIFIAIGLLIYAIISLGYIISNSVATLVIVRFIQGFSAAMIIPIAFAYIGEISPQDREGGYMGIFSVFLFEGLIMFRFSHAFVRGLLISFVPLFAHGTLGLTTSQIGIILSSNILLTSLLQAPFGYMADRLTKRSLVFWGSFWFGLCVVLIPHMRNFAQIFALNIFLGAMGALSLPAANALVVAEGRRFGMGALMGIFSLAMSLGLAASPILGGVIADTWGLPPIFYCGGIAGSIGALAFAGFSRRKRAPFP
jgi:MFS family permease